MRLLLPPVRLRRRVVALLESYFDTGADGDLALAFRLLADFYRIPPPTVQVVDILPRNTLGETTSTGTIRLLSPETWQRQRTANDADDWALIALHEVSHYLHFVDDEAKADLYAARFTVNL